MSEFDTIFALSSGSVPAGVAVIRISGDRTRFALETLSISSLTPRIASLKTIRKQNNLIIDKGLVLFFPNPYSFTGEDCAELHVHGGRAVVDTLFDELGSIDGLRLAEAGEFTKRAYDNGKMDLTEAEGLADLLSSETEMQRRLAVEQADGGLRRLYERWNAEILRSRALIEAELDFSDEEDIPGSVSDQIWKNIFGLISEIKVHLTKSKIGEVSRNGFSIVIAGAPNAGKSSLMNAIAGREVAIVSDEQGTTRDVLEVRLDLDGLLVVLKDTAGLRDTDNIIEREGIRRAKDELDNADLVLYLVEPSTGEQDVALDLSRVKKSIVIGTKSDVEGSNWPIKTDICISTRSSQDLDTLLDLIKRELAISDLKDDLVVPTRRRHIDLLNRVLSELEFASEEVDLPIEIRSEHLRISQDNLGRITGRVDVEDLLGVIFSEFCVGK
ncbi:MAG: tRNA uridine-5-carboxymethylaminomethyl(34) synthesis GTPase MnmE [Lentilitoribacter sp.]